VTGVVGGNGRCRKSRGGGGEEQRLMKRAGEAKGENAFQTAVALDVIVHAHNTNVGLIGEQRGSMVQVQLGM